MCFVLTSTVGFSGKKQNFEVEAAYFTVLFIGKYSITGITPYILPIRIISLIKHISANDNLELVLSVHYK